MPSPRARVGRSAEIAAAAELGRRGYRIAESNYRCAHGEIDLVAYEGGSLVFVEVRCRRTKTYGTPAESVTAAKRRRLIATAEHYLQARSITDTPCRFDVVEVVAGTTGLEVSDVIADAFSA